MTRRKHGTTASEAFDPEDVHELTPLVGDDAFTTSIRMGPVNPDNILVFAHVFEVTESVPVSEKYQDDRATMTYSRRIALYLSQFSWYCPSNPTSRAALQE
jgi:hypothetical protein